MTALSEAGALFQVTDVSDQPWSATRRKSPPRSDESALRRRILADDTVRPFSPDTVNLMRKSSRLLASTVSVDVRPKFRLRFVARMVASATGANVLTCGGAGGGGGGVHA